MTPKASPAPGRSLGDAGVDPGSFRWMGPLAIAAAVLVVAVSFQTQPGPGVRGSHLAVSVALVALAAGTIAVVRIPNPPAWLLILLLGLVVVAAGTLVGLQPDGAGLLGVFPAVSAAALHLPVRAAGLVAVLAMAALGLSWALSGAHHGAVGLVLSEFGVAAFFLLALFARRYREANERGQQLIAELNETRAAQAQAAALAERQRLAREMHDVLAHSLSGLVLNLESARLMAKRGDTGPTIADAISRAQRLAKSGLDEARRAIGMLRGEALPGPERLTEIAAEFEADTGVACTVCIEGEERELHADGRLTLYRVGQEALTNIRRHARPDRVMIRLAYEPAGTELSVEDHSVKSERPAPSDGAGYGLTGMRERAELLGGTLTAGPTPDGFRVKLWIPA